MFREGDFLEQQGAYVPEVAILWTVPEILARMDPACVARPGWVDVYIEWPGDGACRCQLLGRLSMACGSCTAGSPYHDCMRSLAPEIEAGVCNTATVHDAIDDEYEIYLLTLPEAKRQSVDLKAYARDKSFGIIPKSRLVSGGAEKVPLEFDHKKWRTGNRHGECTKLVAEACDAAKLAARHSRRWKQNGNGLGSRTK